MHLYWGDTASGIVRSLIYRGISEYIDYSTTLDSEIYTDTQLSGQNNSRLALPVVKRITADKAQAYLDKELGKKKYEDFRSHNLSKC